MESYVALLRAVNVGGNNKLPMKDLAVICEGLGCRCVKTYIQSGNVVFQADKKTAAKIAAAVQVRIKLQFGFDVPVITRSISELQMVSKNNPFIKAGVETRFLHVLFLSAEPRLPDVAALDPVCAEGEEFCLRGREIYFYFPLGSGNSKLASYNFGKKLHVAATMRNWQTVNKLIDLGG